MDVRLHLAERYAERLRDLLVAELFEVKQHQRHTLMIGKAADGLFEPLVPVRVSALECAGHLRFERALVASSSASGASSSLKRRQRARYRDR